MVSVESMPSPMLSENGLVVEQAAEAEWSYDPNEPRYCVCNQVSYGDMVACDNEHVSIHIFHSVLINTKFGNCFLVSIRMVSLPLCGNNAISERKMVLSEVYCIDEATRCSQISYFYTKSRYKLNKMIVSRN